jgi:hypothetical protein
MELDVVWSLPFDHLTYRLPILLFFSLDSTYTYHHRRRHSPHHDEQRHSTHLVPTTTPNANDRRAYVAPRRVTSSRIGQPHPPGHTSYSTTTTPPVNSNSNSKSNELTTKKEPGRRVRGERRCSSPFGVLRRAFYFFLAFFPRDFFFSCSGLVTSWLWDFRGGCVLHIVGGTVTCWDLG